MSYVKRGLNEEWVEVNLERYERQFFATQEEAVEYAEHRMTANGIEEEITFEGESEE